jgi:hypothetical protein
MTWDGDATVKTLCRRDRCLFLLLPATGIDRVTPTPKP